MLVHEDSSEEKQQSMVERLCETGRRNESSIVDASNKVMKCMESDR